MQKRLVQTVQSPIIGFQQGLVQKVKYSWGYIIGLTLAGFCIIGLLVSLVFLGLHLTNTCYFWNDNLDSDCTTDDDCCDEETKCSAKTKTCLYIDSNKCKKNEQCYSNNCYEGKCKEKDGEDGGDGGDGGDGEDEGDGEDGGSETEIKCRRPYWKKRLAGNDIVCWKNFPHNSTKPYPGGEWWSRDLVDGTSKDEYAINHCPDPEYSHPRIVKDGGHCQASSSNRQGIACCNIQDEQSWKDLFMKDKEWQWNVDKGLEQFLKPSVYLNEDRTLNTSRFSESDLEEYRFDAPLFDI